MRFLVGALFFTLMAASSLHAEEVTGRITRIRNAGPVVLVDFLELDDNAQRSVFWAWPDNVKIVDDEGKAIPFERIGKIKGRVVNLTWEPGRTPDVRSIRVQY